MVKSLTMASSRIWFNDADPGLSETNVEQGNLWLNTSTGNGFICADATFGSQIWNPNAFTAPLSVSMGGLGVSSPTDHAILVGSGTTAITPITVGTTGQVLAGNTGADPSFTANPSVTSLTATGTVTAGELAATADTGGVAARNTITNVSSTTIGAGTGTVKMSSGNNADSVVWIKIYAGTTAYWVPGWATNAP